MPIDENRTVTVGPDSYRFYYLDVKTSLRLSRKLAEAITKSIAPTVGASDFSDIEGLADARLSPEGIDVGLSRLFETIDEAFLDELVKLAGDKTEVIIGDKQPRLSAVMDEHFQGRPLAVYKWLGEFLRFQFADFFSGIGSVTSLFQSLVGAVPESKQGKKSSGIG
jgi:hypothetical protein